MCAWQFAAVFTCRMDSGMIFAKGAPLMGSAEKKHRKSACAVSAAISSLRSNRGIQPCMEFVHGAHLFLCMGS